MEELIDQFLCLGAPPSLLPEADFAHALHNFVEKDEKSAIAEYAAAYKMH
jgi:hypothetical protein